MTETLLCDIYSVSFKWLLLPLSFTHTTLFNFVTMWLVTLTYDSDGLKGSGKTMSLCHVVHFCYTQGWLVLHIPDGEMIQPYLLSAMSVLLLQEYRMCPSSLSCIVVQLISGWRTVRSCSPRPTTMLVLISHCKLLTGYATSEPPTRTSSRR